MEYAHESRKKCGPALFLATPLESGEGLNNKITRKTLLVALFLALTVALGVSAVALATAYVAGWEAETMTGDPSKVTVVSDANAASGQALRYTAKGRADMLDQRLWTEAIALEVSARAVRDAGVWPTMKVYVDGTAFVNRIAAEVVDNSSYVTYRFDVSVPAGIHDVHVKAYENMEQDQELIVDWVAFTGSVTTIDADGDGMSDSSDNCHVDANPSQADTDGDGTGDTCGDDTPLPGGGCDKYASTNGNDAGAGTQTDPYRTVDRLAESLVAGQTGCVRGGVYDQDVSLIGGGAPGNPITVTVYPGESVEFRGTFKANAPWIAVEGLRIDGSYGPQVKGAPYDPAEVHTRPAIEINASHTRWIGNDVSNRRSGNDPDHAGQGVSVSEGATDTEFIGNRIHHAGQLPSDNHQHCVYAAQTKNLLMRGNTIYGCADRGLQMYPNADNSLIEKNIFAYNGGVAVLFGGRGTQTSDNNLVRNNIITHSDDWNVGAFEGQLAAGVKFPQDEASRNEVVDNCVYPNSRTNDPQVGGMEPTSPGDRDYFYSSGNVIASPLYEDPTSGDYALMPGSPCAPIFAGG